MISNQRKVTSYNDFVKSIKGSTSKLSTVQSTTAATPKLAKDIKQNKYTSNGDEHKQKQKHIRHTEDIKEVLTARPKSINKDVKDLKGLKRSIQKYSKPSLTTRWNTDSDMIMTQRSSYQKSLSKEKSKQKSMSKSKSKQKSKSKSHFQSQSSIFRQSGNKRMSDANMIVYYINQVLLVLQQLPRLNPLKITYLDYLQLLRLLNLIQNTYEPNKTDHVHKFWSIISTKDSTINIINFSLMFLATMNICSNSKTIIDIFESSSYQHQIPSVSFQKCKPMLIRLDKYGYLLLNKQQVADIYNQFKQFRTTKMYLGRINKKGNIIEQKLQQHSLYKFHPTISNKSIQLAKIRKEKDSHKNSLNQQMFQQERSKYHEKQKEDVRKNLITPRQKAIVGIKRTQMLYNLCKSKSKEKRDRSQDQIEFERHQKLFTFKPQIHQKAKNKKVVEDKKNSSISGQAKILERFLKGRIEKEVKKKNMQTGNTINSKSNEKLRKKITEQFCEKNYARHPSPIHITPPSKQPPQQYLSVNQSETDSQFVCSPQPLHQSRSQPQSSPQTKKQSSPKKQIFNFQVYLQGGIFVDVIRIYQGDCVEAIAKQFIERHKLKQEMGEKLINSIKLNLESVRQSQGLEQIQQARESVECSFDLDQ